MFNTIRDFLFFPAVVEDKFDKICFNLILFDIFFLPLFPWFSASVSLPIITIWYFVRHNRLKSIGLYKYFGIIIVLMLVSTLISMVYVGNTLYETSIFTSVKLFFMYLTCFWYFFFFIYFFKRYKRNINNIVLGGLICIFSYALFYFIFPNLFAEFKRVICPFDPQVSRWLGGSDLVLRFNFLWADPNNVAYAATGLSLFYIVEEDHHAITKYIVLAMLAMILILTMSMGGIGVAAFLFIYVFLFSNKMRCGRNGLIISLISIVIIVVLVNNNIETITQILDSGLLKRVDAYGDSGIARGGGRLADFQRGVSLIEPFFILVGSGKEGFVTEIGHVYVICLYGFPVYVYFLIVLFGKRKRQSFIEYLPIVPFFVGFTMNIAIIEQKYLLLLMLISAYYYAKSVTLLNDISKLDNIK